MWLFRVAFPGDDELPLVQPNSAASCSRTQTPYSSVTSDVRFHKDYPMPLSIQEGLQRLGHQVRNVSGYVVVQAMARNVDGTLTCKSDPRKSGLLYCSSGL